MALDEGLSRRDFIRGTVKIVGTIAAIEFLDPLSGFFPNEVHAGEPAAKEEKLDPRYDIKNVRKLEDTLDAIGEGKRIKVPSKASIDMPFKKQEEENFCSIACLDMMLGYWGIKHGTQYEMARDIANVIPNKDPYNLFAQLKNAELEKANWKKWKGSTHTLDRAYLTTKFKDNVHVFQGPDMSSSKVWQNCMRYLLSNGIPVRITTKLGGKDHAIVLTGYNKSKVYYLDPIKGKRSLSWSSAKRTFKKGHRVIFHRINPMKKGPIDVTQSTPTSPYEGNIADPLISFDEYAKRVMNRERIAVWGYTNKYSAKELAAMISVVDYMQGVNARDNLGFTFYRVDSNNFRDTTRLRFHDSKKMIHELVSTYGGILRQSNAEAYGRLKGERFYKELRKKLAKLSK